MRKRVEFNVARQMGPKTQAAQKANPCGPGDWLRGIRKGMRLNRADMITPGNKAANTGRGITW